MVAQRTIILGLRAMEEGALPRHPAPSTHKTQPSVQPTSQQLQQAQCELDEARLRSNLALLSACLGGFQAQLRRVEHSRLKMEATRAAAMRGGTNGTRNGEASHGRGASRAAMRPSLHMSGTVKESPALPHST